MEENWVQYRYFLMFPQSWFLLSPVMSYFYTLDYDLLYYDLLFRPSVDFGTNFVEYLQRAVFGMKMCSICYGLMTQYLENLYSQYLGISNIWVMHVFNANHFLRNPNWNAECLSYWRHLNHTCKSNVRLCIPMLCNTSTVFYHSTFTHILHTHKYNQIISLYTFL